MHDDIPCAESPGVIDDAQSMNLRACSFFSSNSGAFVTVRPGDINAGGQGTEIMETCHSQRIIGQEPFNPFPLRDSNAFAKFDMIKSERRDFGQHLVSVRVTA